MPEHFFGKFLLISYFLFMFWSCNSKINDKPTGIWISKPITLLDKLEATVTPTAIELGDSLTIFSNNTYSYYTCGSIEVGNWQLAKDSLYLFCNNRKFRMDTFNQTNFNMDLPNCKAETTVFLLNGNTLKREWQHHNKKVKNWLIKKNF